MSENTHAKYRLQFLFRPGLWMGNSQLAELNRQLREVALTCFEEVPPYQCLLGTRDEFADKAISLAWAPDGHLAGFCSMLLLHVDEVGEVVHLGLTCVRPDDRSAGLTHQLTRKALTSYLVRRKPVGKLWVTNCAAVLSSLGNVALHFEEIFPSPDGPHEPTETHKAIARTVDAYYRDKIYIRHDALFDDQAFVFRGSVEQTVFQKDADDARYHHRAEHLNDFYRRLMDFERGDEVLQVGFCTVLTSIRHIWHRRPQKRRAMAGAAQ